MSVLKSWQRQRILKTARLVLRRPRRSDAQALSHHLSDFRVARMLTHAPRGPQHAAGWIADMRAEIRRGDCRYYVIERNSAVIGLTGLTGFGGPCAELGYWLAHPYWGNGLMSEAVRRIVRAAWRNPTLERIEAVHMVDNEASGRLLLRAGFRYTGVVKLHSRARGMDVVCRTMMLERPGRSVSRAAETVTGACAAA